MRTLLAACACILSTTGMVTQAQSMTTKLYTTLHPLLVDTLTHAKVEGVMTGDIANAFNAKLGMQGPVYVKSELVERLPQSDCGRIKVVFTKRGVATPIGVTDANLRTEMKYCKDGSPPGTKGDK